MRAVVLAALILGLQPGCKHRATASSCIDKIANGSESDVDCGGTVCSACGTGRTCRAATDCQSQHCGDDGRCAAASCSDLERNGSESDVDCGGADCPPCADGQICFGDNDCRSAVCAGDACVAASCNDGYANGGEEGIDCGGPCPPCDGG